MCDYARRLTAEGCEEALIAKALVFHYRWEGDDWGAFFEQFPEARLRHIHLLDMIQPNRSAYSLMLKIEKNCCIDRERAAAWLERYRQWIGSDENVT